MNKDKSLSENDEPFQISCRSGGLPKPEVKSNKKTFKAGQPKKT